MEEDFIKLLTDVWALRKQQMNTKKFGKASDYEVMRKMENKLDPFIIILQNKYGKITGGGSNAK